MLKPFYASVVVSSFMLFACGHDHGNESSKNQTVNPVTSVVLDSANEAIFQKVFAALPSAAELAKVRAEFAQDDRSGLGIQIEYSDTLMTVAGQVELATIISHVSDGYRQYGAVVFPAKATHAMPLLLVSHPSDSGVDMDTDMKFILEEAPGLAQNFVLVIPSFRSESITLNKKNWTSEGPASPWDRDVLDGLRLVSAVESLTVAPNDTIGLPAVDTMQLRSIGFSRGGGVALLAALRDVRIRRVVDYFGPTDCYGTYVERIFRQMLNGNKISLPGITFMDSAIVKPLQAGTLSVDSARIELLRRSPAQFANLLPPVMIHHGEADTTVLISQSQDLWNALSENAATTLDSSFFYIYPNVGHTPIGMQSNFPKSVSFLLEGIPAADVSSSIASVNAALPSTVSWVRTGFSAH